MSSSTTAAQKAASPERIYQVGFGFWGAQVLMTANELDLFTTLEITGPLDAEELRKKLGLQERSARDFFDTLVALGFLNREDGRYSNTIDTSTFLDRNKPSFVGGLFDMCSDRLYQSWGGLREALETGKPQNREMEHTFENLYRDEKRLRQFASAMTGVSMGTARAIAAKFPWKNVKTFVDIGCAQGGTPVQIALEHEHLQGAGYDLPVIRPVFEEYVQSFGLQDRLEFKSGDFFKEELPTADVLIMGHILHDWNLEEKRMLLDKAYRALKPGGMLLVYESLIDDDRRQNAFGLMMSLNMLVETDGGFDYTGADCSGWMKEAGFSETRVEHLVGPDSMVIGTK